jgi:hypothetical protein
MIHAMEAALPPISTEQQDVVCMRPLKVLVVANDSYARLGLASFLNSRGNVEVAGEATDEEQAVQLADRLGGGIPTRDRWNGSCPQPRLQQPGRHRDPWAGVEAGWPLHHSLLSQEPGPGRDRCSRRCPDHPRSDDPTFQAGLCLDGQRMLQDSNGYHLESEQFVTITSTADPAQPLSSNGFTVRNTLPSRLSEVGFCRAGHPDDCLNPPTFEWQGGGYGWRPAPSFRALPGRIDRPAPQKSFGTRLGKGESHKTHVVVDLNGDGRGDVGEPADPSAVQFANVAWDTPEGWQSGS